MNPFVRVFQSGGAWHRVGLASEFPDISEDVDGCQITPSCKAFKIPKTEGESPVEANIKLPGDLKDQVLVFQYKGSFHAIDHQCPHSSFPLSQGSLFDIEDFGITLSTGISCPKHGWSFDIITGKADRGTYKLKVWEVQLRDATTFPNTDKEVWVRRKQRIG
ncbi:Rieske [2Fe-2S] domain protein [Paecilomyces variotii No. 5]|uniref:Rieske [2Fe-2S] domain protein n=1 Tax=Byssochlamys spectabilis (strain No. 5 / NBRC 109023) TaxID=1356009 RepID=V5FD81_BYSSN|nr:Rieske [2Fe-2S] domain protein [Paecilomyces variotii No. 5]